MTDALHAILNFDNFAELVVLVYPSLLAGLIMGIVSGLIGPLIKANDLAFAVHGASELSFAGASAALFLGISVNAGAVAGSLIAVVLIAVLGMRNSKDEQNALIGILLPFGLGLGVLFLSLYKGRSSNKFGLLTGQIVAVDSAGLTTLAVTSLIVIIALALAGRPMFFCAVDPQIARAKNLPVNVLNLTFMVLLGLVTAMAVQIIGALLVLSLLITPAAAATRITASPLWQHVLSVIFSVVAAVGGILLSLGPGLPISPYVTTISFLIFLICWAVGVWRENHGWSKRLA